MCENTNENHLCLPLPKVHFTAPSCLPGCSQKSKKPCSQPKECFRFCDDSGLESLPVFRPTADRTETALGRLSDTSATDPDLQAISLLEVSSSLSQCPCRPICDFHLHGVERPRPASSPSIPARLLHFHLPFILKFPFLVIFVARCWQVSYGDGLPLVLHWFCALLHHVPLPSPAPSVSRFVALHTYSAQGPEELDLKKGEGIRVLGKHQDGWLRGVSLVTGRTGVFPSDYVIPVFRYISRAHLCIELMMADPVSFQNISQEIAFAFPSH